MEQVTTDDQDIGGFDRLKRGFRDAYAVLRGSPRDIEEYAPGEHEPLVSFSGLPGYEEIERYWVDPPFVFVSINYSAKENEHLYYVVEPDLDEWAVTILENLVDDLRQTLIHRRDIGERNTPDVIQSELTNLLDEYGVAVDTRTFHKFLYYLDRRFRGYDQIDPIMQDPYIEDISCDGYGKPLFVYHNRYTDIKTNIEFEQKELDDFVVQLAQQSGRSISIAEPITNATLPDGSRCEFALGNEVTPHGSAFTIRKYEEDPMTPITLMDYGTFSLDQMAYLWLAIQNNKSLIFAGGTASGKTTSMNAISMFIPPRAKVITIEDTQEIRLHHENWLSAVTRSGVGGESNVDMYDLLRSSLRHRPEYIIVGEVRGKEAMTLFQAMNTGHTTYSTMHADSLQTVINRLENNPINVPRSMIQTLDILSIQTVTRIDDERVRRSQELAEVISIDQRTGDLDYVNVFSWDPSEDTFEGGQTNSHLLGEIQEEQGWSHSELLEELRNRKRVLKYAQQKDVTDYQSFTALVNKYYSEPDAVLERVDSELDDDEIE
ncbi:MAG: type II/IV secretion system ATPase subunit [Halobacteriales archaeon]|nr:type II/IV secretion system ATPase subunit [Halobacteriales archaeon]